MTNVSEKVVEIIKRRILYSTPFFSPKPCPLLHNETKYCTAGQSTDHSTARASCMRVYVSLLAHTNSQFVILNAVPLQQWQHKRASLLRYTYSTCLDVYKNLAARVCVSFDYAVHKLNGFAAACMFGRISPKVPFGLRGSRVCRDGH
jgi:hypothetical protein